MPCPPMRLVSGMRYNAPMSLATNPPMAIHAAPFKKANFEYFSFWLSFCIRPPYNLINCTATSIAKKITRKLAPYIAILSGIFAIILYSGVKKKRIKI